MLLHLKAGDGDLPLIMEPALLTRCACISYEIYHSALVSDVFLFNHSFKTDSISEDYLLLLLYCYYYRYYLNNVFSSILPAGSLCGGRDNTCESGAVQPSCYSGETGGSRGVFHCFISLNILLHCSIYLQYVMLFYLGEKNTSL